MEEKFVKKEKDFNRINMTYAKLINRNKNPENNIDKLLDEIDKLKKENKNLNIKINKLKSDHNFIGLSFIADDLEGSQFIDDKCFGEILNGLDKNNNYNFNNNEFKNSCNSEKKDRQNNNENNKINKYKINEKDKDKDKNKEDEKDKEKEKEKEDNNVNEKDKEKEKINRPVYSRRYYKSIRGRENQGNKNENV